MPRGQYDREAARARKEAGSPVSDAIVAAPGKRGARIDRGDDWANRTRKVKGAIDYYDMANGLAPSDAIYQWKTYSIYGQEQKDKQIVYAENGWSAVPHERHTHLPSVGNNIIHEGLILMEQPIELYREARREEDRAHKEQLRMGYEKVRETPAGQMDRTVANVSTRNEVMTIDRE